MQIKLYLCSDKSILNLILDEKIQIKEIIIKSDSFMSCFFFAINITCNIH